MISWTNNAACAPFGRGATVTLIEPATKHFSETAKTCGNAAAPVNGANLCVTLSRKHRQNS